MVTLNSYIQMNIEMIRMSHMNKVLDVVIVGGGQAGLAIGYYLAQQNPTFIIVDGTPRDWALLAGAV